MSTDDESTGQVKVTDKRIFTADGELRSEQLKSPESGPSERTEEKPPPAAQNREAAPGAEKPPEAEPQRTAFSGFVESLVFNAYVNLGMIRDPRQPGVEVDLNGTRQMIDILEMLKEKTMGNLTEFEARLLSDQIAELKLAWVRIAKAL